jgi:hypothetical protein
MLQNRPVSPKSYAAYESMDMDTAEGLAKFETLRDLREAISQERLILDRFLRTFDQNALCTGTANPAS